MILFMTLQNRKILTEKFINNPEKFAPFISELTSCFKKMDERYDEIAGLYGYKCTGCTDNCCYTRFYHHTYLEYFYIFTGYHTLDAKDRHSVAERANVVCEKSDMLDKENKPVRLMCPLNIDNMCILYPYRPMICRLHGMAHELHKPGQPVSQSPGCNEFTKQFGDKNYFPFDRTPFYIELAQLENKLKQSFAIDYRLKMTIAQMLVGFREMKE